MSYIDRYAAARTIDYRCKADRVLVPSSRVTIKNRALLSGSETELNPGIRSQKNHLSKYARYQEVIGVYYIKKK